MNIAEALKIAKEQGKKVRPVGVNWYVVYKSDFIKKNIVTDEAICFYWCIAIEDATLDWEVVKEKTSKQTQYKIDSMKFQIVRYCDKNADCDDCYGCKIRRICHTKPYSPLRMLLDDWSLKDIVEAYHILKKAGEI